MVGSDHAVTTTHHATTDGAGTALSADGCSEYTFDTRFTRFAEYSEADQEKYTNAVATANGAPVFVGGFYVYATYPYIKVYPQISVEVGPLDCAVTFANIYEFKATESLAGQDKLSSPYEHPYGKYLVRRSFLVLLALYQAST